MQGRKGEDRVAGRFHASHPGILHEGTDPDTVTSPCWGTVGGMRPQNVVQEGR